MTEQLNGAEQRVLMHVHKAGRKGMLASDLRICLSRLNPPAEGTLDIMIVAAGLVDQGIVINISDRYFVTEPGVAYILRENLHA